MAKQILEIEVPEGKKAVWEDDRVVFRDVDTMERIKTVSDAVNFLEALTMCEDIITIVNTLNPYSYEWKVAAYRAVVAAVTYNEQRHLTTGERWFPSIEFCRPGKLKNCCGDIIVGRIKSEGEEFDVVGGTAYDGADSGLGAFDSRRGVGASSARIGFRSVGSKKAALYISKQFGKLLFEVSYGGTNCDWKWIA